MTFLDAIQLSEYLAVKAATIRTWTSAGIIPHAKLGPGKKGIVRYPKEEIDKWVKSNLRRERRITKKQEKAKSLF